MERTKKILFIVLLTAMFLPMLQKALKVPKFRGLKGYFAVHEEPDFLLKNWFTGDFQIKYEEYLEQNIGFRTFFVRLNNQLSYSLFDIAKASGVLRGKDNCLYEEAYIKNYLGIDFPGEEKVIKDVEKLKYIVNRFEEKNIKFIFVLAPSKARFYNEYFPEKYNSIPKKDSYKEYYLKHLKANAINVVDFDSYFINNKNSSKYPLYSFCGIHWSTYGMLQASDSLIRYIEKLKNVDLPEIVYDSIELTNKLRDTDYDIADGMNLMFEIPHTDMAYPKYHFNLENKYRPKVAVIGDSYYWNVMGSGIASNVFSNNTFWYYFNELHYTDNTPMKTIQEVNILESLESNDIVMILVSEGTMHKFSYNFIEKVYDLYKNPISTDEYEKLVIKYMDFIKADAKWYQSIVDKANKRNIPVDEMLRLDAIYVIENEKK